MASNASLAPLKELHSNWLTWLPILASTRLRVNIYRENLQEFEYNLKPKVLGLNQLYLYRYLSHLSWLNRDTQAAFGYNIHMTFYMKYGLF